MTEKVKLTVSFDATIDNADLFNNKSNNISKIMINNESHKLQLEFSDDKHEDQSAEYNIGSEKLSAGLNNEENQSNHLQGLAKFESN